MMTGLCFVIAGILILYYPQLLVMMLSALLILFGLGIMVTSWQFRRLKRHTESQFINWIVKY